MGKLSIAESHHDLIRLKQAFLHDEMLILNVTEEGSFWSDRKWQVSLESKLQDYSSPFHQEPLIQIPIFQSCFC